MKRGLGTIAVLSLMVLASAASGAPWYFSYTMSGTLISDTPQYSGILTDYDGTIVLTIDNTGWPSAAIPDTLFNYIWNTYFKTHYIPTGVKRWVATLPGTLYMEVVGAPPEYVGTMLAYIDATFTIKDLDGDKVLDDNEKYGDYNQFNGTIWHPCDWPSTGAMACKEGPGAISGGRFSFTYPPDVDVMDGTGNLDFATCPSATDPSTWGNIKSLYK